MSITRNDDTNPLEPIEQKWTLISDSWKDNKVLSKELNKAITEKIHDEILTKIKNFRYYEEIKQSTVDLQNIIEDMIIKGTLKNLPTKLQEWQKNNKIDLPKTVKYEINNVVQTKLSEINNLELHALRRNHLKKALEECIAICNTKLSTHNDHIINIIKADIDLTKKYFSWISQFQPDKKASIEEKCIHFEFACNKIIDMCIAEIFKIKSSGNAPLHEKLNALKENEILPITEKLMALEKLLEKNKDISEIAALFDHIQHITKSSSHLMNNINQLANDIQKEMESIAEPTSELFGTIDKYESLAKTIQRADNWFTKEAVLKHLTDEKPTKPFIARRVMYGTSEFSKNLNNPTVIKDLVEASKISQHEVNKKIQEIITKLSNSNMTTTASSAPSINNEESRPVTPHQRSNRKT